MKIRHKASSRNPRPTSPDPAYAAEVERHTARSEARYRKAQQRLEHAEQRLTKIQASRGDIPLHRQITEAAAIVELRRRELLALHAVMRAAPQSAVHRGDRSYRPVPPPGDPLP